ncbi:MAG: TonB-dependent receptor plug domain-containing protein [Opitutus sp.]
MTPRTPTPPFVKRWVFTCFTLGASLSMAQVAPTPPSDSGRSSATDEIVTLSPFEVTADTKGYFQANTMSGTRLNSKIEDLGQSITVMTKEQMSDFGMLDINDVFDHMASTEGINSYSQFDTDRTGAVVDQVSLNRNNANRVRGIGSANIAFNNIAMTGRVPIDPLWIDSIELSRGPNANIFGLGNASGTVNQVAALANLTRDFTRVGLRGDSYDGWRASLDVNRTLIKNKLAVRASYSNTHTGFVRKPSGEDERRLSLQVKARPFQNTTISLAAYSYKDAAVRPNFTTPRDYYTDWIRMGKPGWNVVTGLVTLANGQVYGNNNVLGSTIPYTGTPTTLFPGASADGRSMFQIGLPGENPYWSQTRYTNPAGANGTGAFASTDPFASTSTGIGLLQTGPSETYTAAQQPLYNSVARPINDRSIYDWSSLNLAGNGKAWDDVTIYLAQLDQTLISTAKQTLAAQLTYLREDAKRVENNPFGPASVNSNVGQLMVDVNQVHLDGTPNPYFGRPYLKTSEPFLRDKPLQWDTARAQLAYRLDFSQDKGWSKWLGTQQLLGYYEYKDQQNRQYTYRHSALGLDKAWEKNYAAMNVPLGNRTAGPGGNTDYRYPIALGNYSRSSELYYVGSTPGGGIQYAPSYFPEGVSLPYVWGPTATTMIKDVTPIGYTPSNDGAGGGNSLEEIVKTTGGVIQSNFFDGRLITTFGTREDKVYDHNAPYAILTPDLRAYDFDPSNQWLHDWRTASGKTKNVSLVARPFKGIGFLDHEVSNGSGIGRVLAEAVSSFSPTYSNADNFIAQGPAYDLFLKRLPNQTGSSKDIGFWMTLLDVNLSIRYTHFDTKQLNLRNGDITTMAQRILRYEGFVATDAWNLRKQAANWLAGTGRDATASPEQIAAAIKMPIEQYNGLLSIVGNNTYAAVMDMQSKGHELEINYNPTRHWTISASATKSVAIATSAGSAVDDYIAQRMPIWTSLEDPRFTSTTATLNGVTTPLAANTIPTGATGHLLWWNIVGAQFNQLATYDANNSAATNFLANVDAPMAVFRALIGRPRPQNREYTAKFDTRYDLAGITSNKILKNVTVGGSLRWQSKGSIGFYGLGYDPSLNLTLPANKILQLDSTRPIYSPAETYIDLFLGYRTKLFHDKVGTTFQFNVKNVQEDGGRLQKTGAFFDGRASTYRIVDPRQYILSVSFEL